MFKATVFLSVLLVTGVAVQGCGGTSQTPTHRPIELRGVWLTDNDIRNLHSPADIAGAMEFLADHHFNVVFPFVWNNGATLYPSATMTSMFGVAMDTVGEHHDPLAGIIEEAHRRGIAVVPCFWGGFAVPADGGTILQQRPQWAARDREGKAVVYDGFAWLNAFDPAVQDFFISLVSEVVRTYNVDGILGSERLPAQPIQAGYDSLFVADYRDLHDGNAPPLDVSDRHWKYWRAVRVSKSAELLYRRAKALKPDIVVAWAPAPYPRGVDEFLQDWILWVYNDYADFIIPQIRTTDIASYKRILERQSRDSLKMTRRTKFLYPGVFLQDGQSFVSGSTLNEEIRTNRVEGYNGEAIFSYGELRKNNDELARTLTEAFYRTPATLPFTPEFLKTR